jgi:hypothetical protein
VRDDGGVPGTGKATSGALAAGGLVAVGWQLAVAVGWLDWRDDYGGGAENIWQQNLSTLAWIVGTGTLLAGLLGVRLLSGRAWGTAVAALLGGAAVGVALTATQAGRGVMGILPDISPYLVVAVAALLGAVLAGVLGPLSAGTLPGAAVGAVLPWAFAAVDRSRLAYTGDLPRQGVLALVAPAVCLAVPAVCAVLVGTRTGAGWPAALLGATAVPVLLLAAYRLAGPNELDHPQQTEAYSYLHALAPAAVLVAALLAGLTARVPPAPAGRRLPVVAQVLAALVALAVLVVTSSNFEIARGSFVPFAVELTLEILVLVSALVALLVVAVAIDRAPPVRPRRAPGP